MVTVGMKVTLARESQSPIWSQRYLADKSGIPRGRIAQWETGATQQPRREDIERIALLLGIPLEWFYDGKPGPPPMAKTAQDAGEEVVRTHDPELVKGFATTVAVRAWASAIAAIDLEEESYFEPIDVPHEIPAAFLVGGVRNLYKHDLVKVSGRSMSPAIEPGDRVLFFQDKTPKKNTIVMAQSPDHKVFIKALRYVDDTWQLHSLHKSGATITSLKGWEIHGYGVAIFKDVDGINPNIVWPFGQPLKV